MGVLLGLCHMALFDVFLAEPFGHYVTHVLWCKGDRKWIVELVLRHGRDMDILRIREIGLRRAVYVTKKLGHFADTIRAVVEEEQSVII